MKEQKPTPYNAWLLAVAPKLRIIPPGTAEGALLWLPSITYPNDQYTTDWYKMKVLQKTEGEKWSEVEGRRKRKNFDRVTTK